MPVTIDDDCLDPLFFAFDDSNPLDCGEPWGLCAIFDPDGTGGYDVTFSGALPPAADGTGYDLPPVTWTG